MNNCRICGLYTEIPPWGDDAKCPTFEYCPCCNVEFGNQDYNLTSVKNYREKWLNDGGKWFVAKEKPENWNLEEQLKGIPNDFL